MKHKIFAVLFVVFLSVMCISNIISNVNAIDEKFGFDGWSLSTVKSAILFVKDSDALNVPFRKQYIEVNGLLHRICDKEYVHDTGRNDVTKLKNGYLAFAALEEKSLDSVKAAKYVTEFNEFAKKENIDFLYISAPNKLYKDNPLVKKGVYPLYGDVTEFLSLIKENGIDCIDMSAEFKNAGIDQYDMYFKTDHHWTAEGAFFAFQKMCEFMKNEYGYEIGSKFTDINEYTVDTYENYFTGSEGLRTGAIYCEKDDFSLIYPKFSTKLSIESWNVSPASQKHTYAEGDFYNTLFDFERFNKGGSYTYGTYLGSDATLKIIKNLNANTDKKIMLVRDSFGSIFAPYLSLICNELYVVDMRYDDSDRNITEYAKELDIDTVIVLYSNNTIMDTDLVLNFNK